MDTISLQLASASVTAIVTAVLTAYTTSKANERQLKTISTKLDEMEERLYNHENRLSRLEGKLNGVRG